MPINLQHQTTDEFITKLRARYKYSSGARTLILSKRILDWIDDGSLLNVPLRTAFGLTAPQWTTLKNKMGDNKQALQDYRVAKNAAEGE